MIVKFLRGLPASGKSTWSKEFCKQNPEFVRINRDDLRHMRGIYWLPKQEALITDWEVSILQLTLVNGYNAIIDATNLNEVHVEVLQKAALTADPTVTFEFDEQFLTVPVNECIVRDAKREAPVGAAVIMKMYNSYKSKYSFNEKS
jgi:predicted kinase